MVTRRVDDRGVILVTVLIVLVTIASIGISLLVFISLVDTDSQRIAEETKAYYLAEAGVVQAVYMLQGQQLEMLLSKQGFGPVELGDGSFSVRIENQGQPVIVSVGDVNGTKKTIQMRYMEL